MFLDDAEDIMRDIDESFCQSCVSHPSKNEWIFEDTDADNGYVEMEIRREFAGLHISDVFFDIIEFKG